ncbi:LysR family transcriptional regulator [Gottfriedia acidiceleris]|uniref:LysR family transcriptional regulator n=1 Tax=Gottfriedia acidiceleris TaxID=371036 RepID=UPI00101D4584|nr:LysR family transcriptional regulator [Gottfriedia acidiceleris]
MNFDQMEHIVYAAKERSITKAAEKLFISPSGMSQSITQLENELGIKIFNRSKQGVIPTFEGQIVIAKAITLLSTIKDLNKEIHDIKSKSNSHLKILTAPTFTYLLQETMVEFNEEQNEVSFEVVEENPADIIQNFIKQDYDFALIPATLEELKKEKFIEFQHLHKGHMCIAVGKKSPFYTYDSVAPSDLTNSKIVMYKNSDYKTLQKISKMNSKNVVLKSNRSSLLFELVKESQAILYLHEFSIRNRPMVISEDIKIIPLKEEATFDVDFWLIHLASKNLSPLAREFIEKLKKQFNNSI